jgi:hypothetical protein
LKSGKQRLALDHLHRLAEALSIRPNGSQIRDEN